MLPHTFTSIGLLLPFVPSIGIDVDAVASRAPQAQVHSLDQKDQTPGETKSLQRPKVYKYRKGERRPRRPSKKTQKDQKTNIPLVGIKIVRFQESV
eukprot:SAG31_NODE_7326_length_1718_cov_2.975293_2_plen_96_part_00